MRSAKDAIDMSKSRARTKSTKAGVALTADARRKLQQLADWLDGEAIAQRDPRVRFGLVSAVTLMEDNVTVVSVTGALVQMFEPFTRADGRLLAWGTRVVPWRQAAQRAAHILGISQRDVQTLVIYWYQKGSKPATIAKQLRTLK